MKTLKQDFADYIFLKTGVSIHSTLRQRETLETRQIIQSIFLKLGISSVQTGKYFNQDHATMLNSADKIEDLCKFDIEFRQKYNDMVKLVCEYLKIE